MLGYILRQWRTVLHYLRIQLLKVASCFDGLCMNYVVYPRLQLDYVPIFSSRNLTGAGTGFPVHKLYLRSYFLLRPPLHHALIFRPPLQTHRVLLAVYSTSATGLS